MEIKELKVEAFNLFLQKEMLQQQLIPITKELQSLVDKIQALEKQSDGK